MAVTRVDAHRRREDGKTIQVSAYLRRVSESFKAGSKTQKGSYTNRGADTASAFQPQEVTSNLEAPEESPFAPSTPYADMSASEYNERLDELDSVITSAIDVGMDTSTLYAGESDLFGGKWDYTPERAEEQKQLIFDLFRQNENVPRDKRLIVSGGMPGSGKSTTLREGAGIDQSKYMTVNSDDVKEAMAERGMIPEIPGLQPGEHAALIHEESSQLAKVVAQMAADHGYNVILDITMGNEKSVRKGIGTFKDKGYRTEAVFVDVPNEVSQARADSRHRNGAVRFEKGTDSFGGRFVPPHVTGSEYTGKYWSQNRENYENVKDLFDYGVVFDNRNKPTLVETHGAPDNYTAESVSGLPEGVISVYGKYFKKDGDDWREISAREADVDRLVSTALRQRSGR